jgi:hypothetical protein
MQYVKDNLLLVRNALYVLLTHAFNLRFVTAYILKDWRWMIKSKLRVLQSPNSRPPQLPTMYPTFITFSCLRKLDKQTPTSLTKSCFHDVWRRRIIRNYPWIVTHRIITKCKINDFCTRTIRQAPGTNLLTSITRQCFTRWWIIRLHWRSVKHILKT